MDEKAKIHIIYIISILILVIICLLTIQWGHIEELVQLIGFAATITSLVVGIIAIIYSFYANDSFTKTVTELNLASKEIKEGSTELKFKIDSIPISIDRFSSRFEETNELLKKTLAEDKFFNSPANTPQLNDDTISKLLNNIHLSGVKILYIIKKCIDKNIPIELNKLPSDVSFAHYSHITGFIFPLSALGVIKYIRSERKWIFIDLHPYIKANIEALAKSKAKEFDIKLNLDKSKDPDLYDSISEEKNLSNIDAYFEILLPRTGHILP